MVHYCRLGPNLGVSEYHGLETLMKKIPFILPQFLGRVNVNEEWSQLLVSMVTVDKKATGSRTHTHPLVFILV